jgi:LPXTG-site transpeptidase (sortase) family protein
VAGRAHRWLVAAGLVLVLAGLLLWVVRAPEADGRTDAVAPTATRSPETGTTATPNRARWVPGAPRRVLIPALGVSAPVIPVRAPGGTLVPPSDPAQLGWWAGGARPGATRGSALVTGHTVHTGGGALDDLETLERGDRVTVRTDRGTIRYAVRRVAVLGKGAVAREAQRLFDQEVAGRLVLVTCEDWDGQRYLSNVVVVATPVGAEE